MSHFIKDSVKSEKISTPVYQFRLSDWIFGLQILFVAFGALVLVPILAGLDPNVAIILSFCGKLGGFLQTIPVPVMGGILVILFGTIVVVGMQSLVRQGDDLLNPRNLAVMAVILVLGLGGLNFKAGDFALQGIGLSSLMGILFNLLLPKQSVNGEQ